MDYASQLIKLKCGKKYTYDWVLDVSEKSQTIVLGLREHIDDFAVQMNGYSWKQWAKDDPMNWRTGFLEVMNYSGIKICQPTVDEIDRVCDVIGKKVTYDEIHVLSSGGKRYLVVATAKKVWDNDLDIFESSLDFQHRSVR